MQKKEEMLTILAFIGWVPFFTFIQLYVIVYRNCPKRMERLQQKRLTF